MKDRRICLFIMRLRLGLKQVVMSRPGSQLKHYSELAETFILFILRP